MTEPLLPRHVQLRERLLKSWREAGLKVRDQIESQNQIVAACEFSLATVIRTLKGLEADGVIERRVGQGSFLQKIPWERGSFKIGFYYERDVVGGPILSNPFYGPLLQALEAATLNAGHEFFLGSFTRKDIPLENWDRLDAVLLAGIDERFPVKKWSTSALIGILDAEVGPDIGDRFFIDLNSAHEALAKWTCRRRWNRVLYVDAKVKNEQTRRRLSAFKVLQRKHAPESTVKSITCNVEQDRGSAALKSLVTEFKPQLVCGYIRPEWKRELEAMKTKPPVVVTIRSEPKVDTAIVVDVSAWVKQILERMLARLSDRKMPASSFPFPVPFVEKTTGKGKEARLNKMHSVSHKRST